MSEAKATYTPSNDESAALARLREVLTVGQMLHLAELMSALAGRRYGKVEIRIRGDRLFMDTTISDDCGKVVD